MQEQNEIFADKCLHDQLPNFVVNEMIPFW